MTVGLMTQVKVFALKHKAESLEKRAESYNTYEVWRTDDSANYSEMAARAHALIAEALVRDGNEPLERIVESVNQAKRDLLIAAQTDPTRKEREDAFIKKLGSLLSYWSD